MMDSINIRGRLGHLMTGFITLLVIVSCNLYMEDPQENRFVRHDEGYDSVMTITLPDSSGTVKYQYRNNTIGVTDEVEQYVVMLDKDSIVVFVESTPDYFLPDVGEILVSGLRDKFPEGFCGRVVSREKRDGLWYCHCTSAPLEDAFAVLEVNAEIKRTPLPGDSITPAAVILAGEDTDEDTGEEAEEQEARTRSGTRGSSILVDPNSPDDPNAEDVYFTAGVQNAEIKFSAPLGLVTGSGSLSATFTVAPKILFQYKVGPDKHTQIGLRLKGKFNFGAKFTTTGGLELTPPAAIPLLGEKVDLVVVGLQAGVYIMPVIHVDVALTVGFELNNYFNIDIYYEHYAGQGRGSMSCKAATNKELGKKPFTLTHLDDGVDVTLQMGFRNELGIGTKPGLSGAVGAYARYEWKEHLSMKELSNLGEIDATRQQRQKLRFVVNPYINFTANFVVGEVSGLVELPDILSKTVLSGEDLYPTLDKYYFRPATGSKYFDMGFSVKNLGTFNALPLFSYTPVMSVVDAYGLTIADIPLEATKDPMAFSAKNQRISDFWYDTDYTLKLYMKSNYGTKVLVGQFPLRISGSTVAITKLRMVQSTKGKWTIHGENYNYRFRVRAYVRATNTPLIAKWGVRLISEENYRAEIVKDLVGDYPGNTLVRTVDFHVYAKDPDIMVTFYPLMGQYKNTDPDVTDVKDFHLVYKEVYDEDGIYETGEMVHFLVE